MGAFNTHSPSNYLTINGLRFGGAGVAPQYVGVRELDEWSWTSHRGCFGAYTPATTCGGFERCGYTCVGAYCGYSRSHCLCDCSTCANYYPNRTLDESTGQCVDGDDGGWTVCLREPGDTFAPSPSPTAAPTSPTLAPSLAPTAPTATPTIAPTAVGQTLAVTTGRQFCELTPNGTCVTDGSKPYGSDEACTVTALVAGTLTSVGFVTQYGDRLTVGGRAYQGRTGPFEVVMAPGETFSWSSSSYRHSTGWTVCLLEGGTRSPTPTPTTRRPTTGRPSPSPTTTIPTDAPTVAPTFTGQTLKVTAGSACAALPGETGTCISSSAAVSGSCSVEVLAAGTVSSQGEFNTGRSPAVAYLTVSCVLALTLAQVPHRSPVFTSVERIA